MRIKTLLMSIVLLSCSHAAAEEPRRFVWSYTMEEMYQMATFFKNIRSEKGLEDVSQYLKASEFKGYVAAILDNSTNQDKTLTECARKYPVNDIAMRTAIVITSNPLDRSQMSAITVHVAIRFACEESTWKKNK